MRHHPSRARSPRARSTAALVGAVAGALMTALVLFAAPAQALAAVPVDCGTDEVVLTVDHLSYDLEGACGVVVVEADDTEVSMPTATRLVVRGHGNEIVAGPQTRVVVRGRDNSLSTPTIRSLRLASPGSVVAVEGLLEKAVLARRGGTVRADQVTELRIDGGRHRVRARRGHDALVRGDRNQLRYRRLGDLVVAGDRNDVRVRRGETRVRVTGTGNIVRVHRRC